MAAKKKTKKKKSSKTRSGVAKELAALGKMLEALVKEAAASKSTSKLKRQAKKVVEAGKNDTKKVRGNIAKGLRAISKELGRFAKSIEK